MTTWDGERWQAAAGELDALLELEPDAREQALAALFRRDAGVASDVAQLLAALNHADAERFLADGAAPLPAADATGPSPRIAAGTEFGGYRILSVVGRGGMGVVYAAEELESGRRLALKVLEQRLADTPHRERFTREGRLAASIDHPHCVFVFAADDVDGRPFIAMELMAGTLADRLTASGPMAPAAAVDAALQLVAGLEAAAGAGVLHRDVKPSNCFVDADGTVKIGDFGISRSTRGGEPVTTATKGAISATPMYASPEQLRGAPVDVRSDIYSLGATLYELVTGRRPFDADDLMSLLMRVAHDVPAAPHAIDPAIPRGLSDVIVRCLAKQPEQRFAGYGALDAALRPFGSAAPTPATVGRRLVAGIIDGVVTGLVQRGLALMVLAGLTPGRPRWWWYAGTVGLPLLYYGLSEGLYRRSPGKALCGLQVVDTAGRPARAGRVWLRATLFTIASLALSIAYARLVPIPGRVYTGGLRMAAYAYGPHLLFLAVMFVVARRRNGYAALHDLASGTRVVAERSTSVTARPTDGALPAPGRVAVRYGPFVGYDRPIDGLEGWRPGTDQRLRRPVWIRELPPGTPAIPASRAALTRATRLRWLAGRREASRGWDVYDGAAGRPVTAACAGPRRWSEVRGWLLDLARELAAQGPDDRPPLRLDRVWILASGRSKLLDDPTTDVRLGSESQAPVTLLRDIALLGRGAAATPWPLSADRFVETLDTCAIGDAVTELEALGDRDQVSRTWRALSLAPPIAVVLAIVAGPLLTALAPVPPMPPTAHAVVQTVAFALKAADRRQRPLSAADREALEIVLAAFFRTDPKMIRSLERHPDGSLAPRVAAIVRRHPTDAGCAHAFQRPIVESILERRRPGVPAVFYLATLVYDGLVKGALVALVSAIAGGGLLLRLLGFAVVTRSGRASPLRLGVRAAVAWAAILVPAIPFALSSDWYTTIATHVGVVYVALGIQLAGTAVAIWSPTRGLADRLAGTWIVPR